jgi:hypothetical protein
MNESHRPPDAASVKRRQLEKRAKRGLIAGYIHALSERHASLRPDVPGQRAATADSGRGVDA